MARKNMHAAEGPLWLTWIHMRERCRDSNHPNWDRYGGRGIAVEEPWLSDRHSFYAWAHANGYEKGMSLDRIDNDANYSPDNCRWVAHKDQMRNTSRTRMITIGNETKCKADWMTDPRVTIGYGTYYKRKKNGWTDEQALFTSPGAEPYITV